MEISNLLDKGVKVMVIKMHIQLKKRIEEHSENFNKQLENTKKEPIGTEEYND